MKHSFAIMYCNLVSSKFRMRNLLFITNSARENSAREDPSIVLQGVYEKTSLVRIHLIYSLDCVGLDILVIPHLT
jgi:hypothetical protein